MPRGDDPSGERWTCHGRWYRVWQSSLAERNPSARHRQGLPVASARHCARLATGATLGQRFSAAANVATSHFLDKLALCDCDL